MKYWILHTILLSLSLLISCEKSFDSITPKKSEPPDPPITTTVPPSANLMFWRGDIYFLDTLGVETRLTFQGVYNGYPPVFSPDGSEIAFVTRKDGNYEIYIMNSDGTDQQNLTNHPARDDTPVFSPDGSYLIFNSNRSGNWEIHSMNLDGSNLMNLTKCDFIDSDPTFSPDGSKIAFTSKRDDNLEVYIMDADGQNQQNLTNCPYPTLDYSPIFSPDGSKILFVSIRNYSNANLYIMNSDGTDQKYLARLVNSGASYGGGIPKIFTNDGNNVIYEQRGVAGAYSPEGIYIIDIEGINPRLLSTRAELPNLSPDGSKIAFSWGELYEMNIDGTERVRLTDNHSKWPIYQPVQR